MLSYDFTPTTSASLSRSVLKLDWKLVAIEVIFADAALFSNRLRPIGQSSSLLNPHNHAYLQMALKSSDATKGWFVSKFAVFTLFV